MRELSILEVRASHVYLLAECRFGNRNEDVGNDGGTDPNDPVSKAMELIQLCDRLANSRRGTFKKVKDIKKSLQKFLVKMLDLCQPGDHRKKEDTKARKECEIAQFLSKDDKLKGISIKG